MRSEKCRICGSDEPQYAHGASRKGEARYRCKSCKKTYTLTEPKYSEEFKKAAIKVYLEGNSGRAVGRIMGISKNTIWGWLQKYSENLPKIKEADTEIAEMDELYTYIKKD